MKRLMTWGLAPLALMAMIAAPAVAKGPDGGPPGHAKKGGAPKIERLDTRGTNGGSSLSRAEKTLITGAAVAGVALAVDYFTDGEIHTIRDFYRDLLRREGHIPAGYATLPPGIQKNLARGKPLPPGIAKRFPPRSLLDRLPARPGYERVIVGNDILLVAVATGVIVDVLVDVFAS